MIKYYYGARQIGKTSKALERYLENPDKTAICFHNRDMCHHAISICRNNDFILSNKNDYNFFSFESAPGKMKSFDTFILDEFDLYPEQKKNELLSSCFQQAIDVIIYTTPKYLRNPHIYAFVTALYNSDTPFKAENIAKEFYPSYTKELVNELHIMYNDPIVQFNIKPERIPTPLWRRKQITQKLYYSLGNEDQCQLQIQGNFFRDDNYKLPTINCKSPGKYTSTIIF